MIGVAIAVGVYFKSRGSQLADQKTAAVLKDQGELHEGDIIFQTSGSAQSKAIELATHSRYSHCGILYKKNGAFYVYEAVQPVSIAPLEQWISRGKGQECVVKRLKGSDTLLTADVISNMKDAGSAFSRKNYDAYFEWSDERIYCSELVWKIYDRGAHIQLCKPSKLKDFDFSNPLVKQKLEERYGSNIPLEETVVSPADLFNSKLLYTIKAN
jgi:hypothetical protein